MVAEIETSTPRNSFRATVVFIPDGLAFLSPEAALDGQKGTNEQERLEKRTITFLRSPSLIPDLPPRDQAEAVVLPGPVGIAVVALREVDVLPLRMASAPGAPEVDRIVRRA